jgi:signal transduction histidine kinase
VLRKRIEITTVPGQIPMVDLNRDLIEWVFENLMKNSINAIRRDDGVIEIRTEYIEVDRVVRVSHSDNGAGIARKDRGKVFSPGFTTKKRGWGLGLTLAKRIVEDYHRGRIYLSRSIPDRETVFYVDLPVSRSGQAVQQGENEDGGST